MAGLGPQDKGSASDLLGSVLSPEAEEKKQEKPKEDEVEEVEAKDDNEYALRLQLMEYEDLERSLPEDLRPDENDLEARLALLRDIAQQQFYMQQQDGVQALLGELANEEDFDESGDSAFEEEEEEEGGEVISRVLEMLRSMGEGGVSSLQALAMVQEQLRGLGVTLVPHVDVDNMSYEELTDLCESVGKVNVGLTAEQIEARTHSLEYSADLDVLDKKCAVCMCEFEPSDPLRQLTCPHVFHADCIDQWLAESKKCPVCSVEVLQRTENPIKKKVAAVQEKPSTPEPKPKKQKQTPPKDSEGRPVKKKAKKKAAKRDGLLLR